jgi:DNA mismatch endonuclease (patch repair protein)
MRAVHGKDTQPECAVRSSLHRAGYRFRVHRPDLAGKPDIVLPRYRTVIFVNGCFWHQHPGCRKATIPVNNRKFWKKKLTRTVQRDAENVEKLAALGWRSIIVWECEMKESMEATMERIFNCLRGRVQDSGGMVER